MRRRWQKRMRRRRMLPRPAGPTHMAPLHTLLAHSATAHTCLLACITCLHHLPSLACITVPLHTRCLDHLPLHLPSRIPPPLLSAARAHAYACVVCVVHAHSYDDLSSGDKRQEWKDAAAAAARASGELAVVHVLTAAHTSWDEHGAAITQRNLRATRFATVDAKLKYRRAQLRATRAKGARQALSALNAAAADAAFNARAFSIRQV